MRYEIHGESVRFYLDTPKRDDPIVRKVSFEGTRLNAEQIRPMLDLAVERLRAQSLHSQINFVTRVLARMFRGFLALEESWPSNSQDWTLFALNLFEWYLTTDESGARTYVRLKIWRSAWIPWFSFLKEAEIIPLDVVIPSAKAKKLASLGHDVKSLLGHGQRNIVDPIVSANKLLVDVSLVMTDADYLEGVDQQCRHLVGVVKDVCLKHWRGFMQDAEAGRRLASQVSDVMISQALTDGRYGETLKLGRKRQFIKYASFAHPQGIAWALAWVRYSLLRGESCDCVSADTLRQSPLFQRRTLLGKQNAYAALDELTCLTSKQWQLIQSQARFYRFAGLLSGLDVAAAVALITIEHPQFTSEALQNAVLLNVCGKSRLLLTDNVERAILTIDKPRAGKLKSAALSELAQEIVRDIVRVTAPVRKVLRRAGDKRWRYLFLGALNSRGVGATGKVGVLSVMSSSTKYLNGSQASIVSLPRIYPELTQNGLVRGFFDYRRLRNTMGVIRWFETGSVLEMSRKLGNTRKVVLEHYLPPVLLSAWNTRIIRRFQNTLIVLAAHDESYLLDVTDFSSVADLQHFVSQLVLDYPANTSPLAGEVQLRLGGAQQSPPVSSKSAPALLNVRLSPRSLAYLYSFRDFALKTLSPEQQDKMDDLSGMSPRQFIDMATLLSHAAENTEIHPALRSHLDITQLIETHGKALALKGLIDMQFSKLVLKQEWEAS